MLNEIGIVTPRVPIHSHPFDFISLPESEIVYEGDLKKYKK